MSYSQNPETSHIRREKSVSNQPLFFSNYFVLHVFMISEKDTNMAEISFLLSESLMDETYRLLRHRTIICEGLG